MQSVIATTSNLGHDRLEFYKDLYARSGARATAALWIVAANLSSYSDIDDIINWVGSEQTTTVNGASKLVKPALVPTLLFPFAARVSGSMADAGPQAESQMRLLLWSVERLIAGLAPLGSSINVGHRLHVVIPGSPTVDASVATVHMVNPRQLSTQWSPAGNAERGGGEQTLVHAHIGWVRGDRPHGRTILWSRQLKKQAWKPTPPKKLQRNCCPRQLPLSASRQHPRQSPSTSPADLVNLI